MFHIPAFIIGERKAFVNRLWGKFGKFALGWEFLGFTEMARDIKRQFAEIAAIHGADVDQVDIKQSGSLSFSRMKREARLRVICYGVERRRRWNGSNT